WSFGTESMPPAPRDPFTAWTTLDYSGFDRAKAKFDATQALTDCDLRLAVFYWDKDDTRPELGNQILFVDNWTVRRRPSRSSKLYLSAGLNKSFPGWAQSVSDQLAAEGEARFLQFQDQLDSLRTSSDSTTLVAVNNLRYLPPAGYV